MNKIICDICGTSYSDKEDKCPICGYSREFNDHQVFNDSLMLEENDLLVDGDLIMAEPAADAVPEEETEAAAAPVVKAAEEADVVIPVRPIPAIPAEDAQENGNDAEDEDEDEDEEEDEDEKVRSSPLLIILLVLVIIALLGVSGFIFVKYYLPSMKPDETVPETTVAIVETTEATDATVPCTSLVMTSDGEAVLEQEGANWMINVVAMPEDTTDEVMFTSSDESVATVSESGVVTAVGEGTAVITVTCGDQQITMEVTCSFVPETTVADVTEPTSTETEEPSEAETTVPETEAPTEAPTEPAGDLVLKLHKTDISFNRVGEVYRLKVTEGIDPADVEWTSTNGNVAFAIDGVVQIVGPGTATIVATYKGQEARCIIRVSVGGTTSGTGSSTSGTGNTTTGTGSSTSGTGNTTTGTGSSTTGTGTTTDSTTTGTGTASST